MAFEYLSKEKILLSFNGPNTTADQWDRYIAQMQSISKVPNPRFLVLVEGPPPSPAVQRRIAEHVQRDARVALVSSSTALRFVVSAFSLVNRTIKYFSPAQLPAALAHLDCSELDAQVVYGALERLQYEP